LDSWGARAGSDRWSGCCCRLGDTSSCGGWRLEMSSPSSASRAMIFPTTMFFEPSGTYRCTELAEDIIEGKAHQDHSHDTVVLRLHVNGGLVCFLQVMTGKPGASILQFSRTYDLKQDISRNERLSVLLFPPCNTALGHRWGHGRHFQVCDCASSMGLMQH
jgi:hypothetical protein